MTCRDMDTATALGGRYDLERRSAGAAWRRGVPGPDIRLTASVAVQALPGEGHLAGPDISRPGYRAEKAQSRPRLNTPSSVRASRPRARGTGRAHTQGHVHRDGVRGTADPGEKLLTRRPAACGPSGALEDHRTGVHPALDYSHRDNGIITGTFNPATWDATRSAEVQVMDIRHRPARSATPRPR